MGMGKLNIWVSDVADPCGTWSGEGYMTILDCKGVLAWPCGHWLAPDGTWQPVPRGEYRDLKFVCGHLEVEVPPGCYWVVCGGVYGQHPLHFNYTTHVGIVQVGCDETACVKLYNPSLRLCWDWFLVGLRGNAVLNPAALDPGRVDDLEKQVNAMLERAPRLRHEAVIEQVFEELLKLRKE
jgi:hypothetical protein